MTVSIILFVIICDIIVNNFIPTSKQFVAFTLIRIVFISKAIRDYDDG